MQFELLLQDGFSLHKNAVHVQRQPIGAGRQIPGGEAELPRAGGLLPPVGLPDDFPLRVLQHLVVDPQLTPSVLHTKHLFLHQHKHLVE